MNHSEDHQFVEQVLESLRRAATPDGPSSELVVATTARLQAEIGEVSTSPRNPRREVMLRFLRFGGATAVCASMAVAIVWFGGIERSSAIAFADVQAQLQKTRSVQWVETRLKLPGETVHPNQERHYRPRRKFVLGQDLLRTEMLDADGSIREIQIHDNETWKYVELYPKEKRYQTYERRPATDAKPKRVPLLMYDFMHEIPPNGTKRLPAKKLDGKQVVGFEVDTRTELTGETITTKRTLWVDPQTKLPVRIEVSSRSTDKRLSSDQDWVQTDFVFDQELPRSLFSTEPPEGYSIETVKFGRK